MSQSQTIDWPMNPRYCFPSAAVCSKMEHTEFSLSSPSLNRFFKCLVIACLRTPNNSPICAWVNQTVSPSILTSSLTLSSGLKITISPLPVNSSSFFMLILCYSISSYKKATPRHRYDLLYRGADSGYCGIQYYVIKIGFFPNPGKSTFTSKGPTTKT